MPTNVTASSALTSGCLTFGDGSYGLSVASGLQTDGTNIYTSGELLVGDSMALGFNGRTIMASLADGWLKFTKSGGSILALLELGGLRVGVRAISSASTIQDSDFAVICDTDGGAFSQGLPNTSTDQGDRRVLLFVNDGSNSLTLTRDGTNTINGNTSLGVDSGEWALLFGFGDNWYAKILA